MALLPTRQLLNHPLLREFSRRRLLQLAGCASVASSAGLLGNGLHASDNAGADRFHGIDNYVTQALTTWEIPGLALAVVKDGAVVLARGYGVCEVGAVRRVTADTVFTISSCTKSFVAASLAVLVEEGKLEWDEPVHRRLPDFELATDYLTEHVTIRDLVCHRTGLRRADTPLELGLGARHMWPRLKLLEPIAELRTRLIYNNHMYDVLAEVVARVANQPLEKFVRERILEPLGMQSSTWTSSDVPPERLALRHWRSDAGIVSRPAPRVGGGLYSTVGDLAQWLKLQLAEGSFSGKQLLKPATIREMHSLQFSVPIQSRPPDNIYAAQFYGSGLGWSVQDYRGQKLVSHAGAWGAMTAFLPARGLGVVVLSNLDLEYLCALLMYDVFDAYLVSPQAAWNTDKWQDIWLRHEPPGNAYRARDEAQARLAHARRPGTQPALPLEKYAGVYESPLAGRLVVRIDDGRLLLVAGEYTTPLSHWQADSFYARSPTRMNYDWLITFQPVGDGQPGAENTALAALIVQHIGWDQDERDQRFVRGPR